MTPEAQFQISEEEKIIAEERFQSMVFRLFGKKDHCFGHYEYHIEIEITISENKKYTIAVMYKQILENSEQVYNLLKSLKYTQEIVTV